jgi:hypothetical protein
MSIHSASSSPYNLRKKSSPPSTDPSTRNSEVVSTSGETDETDRAGLEESSLSALSTTPETTLDQQSTFTEDQTRAYNPGVDSLNTENGSSLTTPHTVGKDASPSLKRRRLNEGQEDGYDAEDEGVQVKKSKSHKVDTYPSTPPRKTRSSAYSFSSSSGKKSALRKRGVAEIIKQSKKVVFDESPDRVKEFDKDEPPTAAGMTVREKRLLERENRKRLQGEAGSE